MKDPCSRSKLVYAGLAAGAALALWAVTRRIRRKDPGAKLLHHDQTIPARASSAAVETRRNTDSNNSSGRAIQQLYRSAAILATSVLVDSTIEHYRGCFFRPIMYLAPTVSTLALAESSMNAVSSGPSSTGVRKGVFLTAVLTGIAGSGFHIYNVGKREGSFSWLNFFYGAPIGAPAALALSGLLGLAADRLESEDSVEHPQLLGASAGRVLAAVSALGMLGTVYEAGLLHFRGAFQDPFQYVPVTIPPLATAALVVAAIKPTGAALRVATAAMKATGLIGIAGIGFHAYGIHRNMGGWYNSSQMVLQGPPLPAPLGFTGLALSSLSALGLIEGGRKQHERIQEQVPQLQRSRQVEHSVVERADQESRSQTAQQRSGERVFRS